jgi:hypothetical protein
MPVYQERHRIEDAPRDRRGYLTGSALAIHVLLVLVRAAIGFDTVFELTTARESNGIVAAAGPGPGYAHSCPRPSPSALRLPILTRPAAAGPRPEQAGSQTPRS